LTGMRTNKFYMVSHVRLNYNYPECGEKYDSYPWVLEER
jgi:hypothetical protein